MSDDALWYMAACRAMKDFAENPSEADEDGYEFAFALADDIYEANQKEISDIPNENDCWFNEIMDGVWREDALEGGE